MCLDVHKCVCVPIISTGSKVCVCERDIVFMQVQEWDCVSVVHMQVCVCDPTVSYRVYVMWRLTPLPLTPDP